MHCIFIVILIDLVFFKIYTFMFSKYLFILRCIWDWYHVTIRDKEIMIKKISYTESWDLFKSFIQISKTTLLLIERRDWIILIVQQSHFLLNFQFLSFYAETSLSDRRPKVSRRVKYTPRQTERSLKILSVLIIFLLGPHIPQLFTMDFLLSGKWAHIAYN